MERQIECHSLQAFSRVLAAYNESHVKSEIQIIKERILKAPKATFYKWNALSPSKRLSEQRVVKNER